MRVVEHWSPSGYPLLPLDGDPAHMIELADDCDAAVEQTERSQALLADVSTGLPGAGQSIVAARTSAEEAIPSAAELERAIALLSSLLRDYAASVDDLQPRFATHTTVVAEAVDDLAAASAQYAIVASVVDGPDHPRADEATQALAAMQTASDEADAAWSAYEIDYEQWLEAYERARTMLSPSGSGLAGLVWRVLLAAWQRLDPDAVAQQWAALSDAEQAALIAHDPELVGNLEGVPVADRHAANLLVLEAAIAAAEASGIPVDPSLEQIAREVSDHEAFIVSLEVAPNGPARAALAYGDIETADQVAVIVPGANATPDDAPDYRTSALALNAAVTSAGGGTSATVVWFGYETPVLGEALEGTHADDGAAALAAALAGIDSVRSDTSTLSVVGYSYGSTTAGLAIAAAGDAVEVDRFISVGSAGFEQEALDLGDTEVYATTAPGDLVVTDVVPLAGRAAPETVPGTVVFESDGGTSPTGAPLAETPGHDGHDGEGTGYLQQDTESLYGIAWIIAHGEVPDTGRTPEEPS